MKAACWATLDEGHWRNSEWRSGGVLTVLGSMCCPGRSEVESGPFREASSAL